MLRSRSIAVGARLTEVTQVITRPAALRVSSVRLSGRLSRTGSQLQNKKVQKNKTLGEHSPGQD